MDARVSEVTERQLGSALAADAAAGATVITVADATDFDDAGVVSVDAEVISYTLTDLDAGTLTLATPLVSAHSTDAPVVLNPVSVERLAVLIATDDAQDDEGLIARVPHALYDRIPVGARAGSLGESVQADYLADELVIQDITGQVPDVDGSYIDPGTLPDVGGGSDGLAPTASPTPTIVPGIGTLHVLWNAITNPDPVTYDVHLSSASGYTPSSATLVASTPATAVTIRATPLANLPLDPATTYYVRVIARDEDGAAAASPEVAAMPAYVTGPDIAAQTITGENIVGETITADLLASVLVMAAQIVVPAQTGQRVVIDPAGIRLVAVDSGGVEYDAVRLPTDAGQGALFTGQMIASGGLIVPGTARIQGPTNVMEKGSQLTLQAQLGAPASAPTLAFEYDTDLTNCTGAYGMDMDPSGYRVGGTTGQTLLIVHDDPGGAGWEVAEWDTSAKVISRRMFLFGYAQDVLGVARCGAYIHVIYRTVSSGVVKVRTLNQSDLSLVAAFTPTMPPGLDTSRLAAGGDGTNIYMVCWTGTAAGSAKQVIIWDGSSPTTLVSTTSLSGGLTRAGSRYFGGVTARGGPLCVLTYRTGTTPYMATYELYNQATPLPAWTLQTADGNTWSPTAVASSGNSVDSAYQGGVTWDATASAYRGMAGASGILIRFNSWVWPIDATGNKWWFETTFYQATGGYETVASPIAGVQLDGANPTIGRGATTDVAMRGQVRVISPPIPTDASTERIYMLRSAAAPVNTTMRRQTPAATSSSPSSFTFYMRTYSAAGALYVHTNTFPAGTSVITGDVGANVTGQWRVGGAGTFLLPRFTTAQRLSGVTTPTVVKGQFQWNEDRGLPEYYDGAAWRSLIEVQAVAVDVTSTAAHSSGQQAAVLIPGLAVGDYCFWIGRTAAAAAQFHFWTESVCATAGQIRLRWFNADSAVNDPASETHYFLIIHTT